MTFLELVRREMEGSLGRLIFVSAMGGVSTTAIIGARSTCGPPDFSSSRCCYLSSRSISS
jgi:hypothetical protein